MDKPGHLITKNKPHEFESSVPLSTQTEQLIQKMFLPSEHGEVRQFLTKLGNDLYPDFYDKDQLEDLRLLALKSKGDLKKLLRETAWLLPKYCKKVMSKLI